MTAWCDECGKTTTRTKVGKCKSCISRKGGLKGGRRCIEIHGTPYSRMSASERMEFGRRVSAGSVNGGKAVVAKHGNFFEKMTPERRREVGRKGGLVTTKAMGWDPSRPWEVTSFGPQNAEEARRVADYLWTFENVPFEVRAGLVEAEGMAA